jgi:hypothetical protein
VTLRAFSLIRDRPWYRRQAFELGLKRAGYEVLQRHPARGAPGDVLLIWNRYGGNHEIAAQFERQGGTVLVAENGYIGQGGVPPKFDVHPAGPQPGSYYALALGWHNGRGRWPAGGPERLNALGVELNPWRTEGDHILVCPNRSFGVGEQVMHPDWGQRCAERLRKHTKRPVRVRWHPGNDAPKRALSEDLKGAWAVVVWSSSVALHALAGGIPTFIEAPWQVVKGAGASGSVDDPLVPDRLPAFERMAWAQYTCAEIESGYPFQSFRELIAA